MTYQPDPRLIELAAELDDLVRDSGIVPNDWDLEAKVRWHVNSGMAGDGGIAFLSGHRAAIRFIAYLLRHNTFVGENVEPMELPPIPMVLFCPGCGKQHIDEATPEWDNPPHRSHKCQTEGCGTIWRTADVSTAGVISVETRGKTDDWTPGMATGTKNPQIMLLAEALMNVLVKAGMIHGEVAMSGPELLMAAETFCQDANGLQENIQRLVDSARHFAECHDGPGDICRLPMRTVKELCNVIERFAPTADNPVEDRYCLFGVTSISAPMFELYDCVEKRTVASPLREEDANRIVNALNRTTPETNEN